METPIDITNAEAPTKSYSHRQVLIVFSGLALGMLLAALDQTIVATALPTIVGDVGGSEHLSWVVTAYLLAATVSTPLYGKLGDLYGRKRLFQAAILIFLVGSVLCGAAQTMAQLIACRAIQGLGGGGLMVLGMASIADVVSPRERGRYQGYFAALFGFASVAGPLLGGIFTDQLSWRWVFYINVPLGIAALIIASLALPSRVNLTKHVMDYKGSALLVVGISSIVLITTWGGSEYEWDSPLILSLMATVAICFAVFIFVERRAVEPIMPLRIFSEPTLRIVCICAVIVGVGMLTAVSFLPLLLQIATGASATNSGLVLMPLLLAMPGSSMLAGQIISRTGHYKAFPIIGMALASVGFYLLSTIGADTTRLTSAIYMLIVGTGFGFTMPVLVLSAQNTASSSDLGVATSTVAFARSVGGSVGVAAFGALYNTRLAARVAESFPGSAAFGLDGSSVTPEGVRALPDGLQSTYTSLFADALGGVFLFAVPVLVCGILVLLLLKEVPLRTDSHVSARAGEVEAEAEAASTVPDEAFGDMVAGMRLEAAD